MFLIISLSVRRLWKDQINSGMKWHLYEYRFWTKFRVLNIWYICSALYNKLGKLVSCCSKCFVVGWNDIGCSSPWNRRSRCIDLLFLTSQLYSRERDPVPILQEWLGPRTGLDRCGSPPPKFDPRTVHPVSCRHTDWAIPTYKVLYNHNNLFFLLIIFNTKREKIYCEMECR
jgi:hypothetical protein